MTSTGNGADGGGGHCCKISRVADRHDVSGVGGEDVDAYLSARWLGESGYPESSLAELVGWLNRRVMRTVYGEHDRLATETQLDSEYESLRSGDEYERALLEDDLAEDGVDPDRLRDSFVSVATMHRHLRNCLDVTKPDSGGGKSDWEAEKVAYALDLARDNVADAVQSWENKGEIPFGTDADIGLRVYLECPVCRKQVDVDRARERGYVCEAHMSEATGPPADHRD